MGNMMGCHWGSINLGNIWRDERQVPWHIFRHRSRHIAPKTFWEAPCLIPSLYHDLVRNTTPTRGPSGYPHWGLPVQRGEFLQIRTNPQNPIRNMHWQIKITNLVETMTDQPRWLAGSNGDFFRSQSDDWPWLGASPPKARHGFATRGVAPLQDHLQPNRAEVTRFGTGSAWATLGRHLWGGTLWVQKILWPTQVHWTTLAALQRSEVRSAAVGDGTLFSTTEGLHVLLVLFEPWRRSQEPPEDI